MSESIYNALRGRGYSFSKRVAGHKYGIEIELEGGNIPNSDDLKLWYVHNDGSLRGMPDCAEYVTGVCNLQAVANSLNEFKEVCEKRKTREHKSIRTSVHIHANVQDFTAAQIASIITTYLIVEGSLYSVCGDHREGNTFCVPLTTAPSAVMRLGAYLHAIHIKGDIRSILTDSGTKYLALNPRPILTGERNHNMFGTLEFRAHEGTIDTDRILLWVNLIDKLIKYSINHTPQDILFDFSAKGVNQFFDAVFGVHSSSIEVNEDSAWVGVDLAHSIAGSLNWEEVAPKEVKNLIDEDWTSPPPPRANRTRVRTQPSSPTEPLTTVDAPIDAPQTPTNREGITQDILNEAREINRILAQLEGN